ncbi:ROK family protein [Subtercola boreus]|uniref:ROK family protein n=1 Tax=Subtercola boreus TaxID=120213 RepID=UPI00209BD505|nr:ROK family protein [Subtercola boreus]
MLEIGGTHATAALVDPSTWTVAPEHVVRAHIDAAGSAESLLSELAAVANRMPSGHADTWVVAIPGPFDYVSGVGRFRGVGKFDDLFGVDLRQGLRDRIDPRPSAVTFVNDAVAFGVGEYAIGAARGHDRAVFVTLGTGVGSAYLEDGHPVTTGAGVPLEGSAHRILYDGRPLEETFSRRAIRSAYSLSTTSTFSVMPDVREIAERSRAGDRVAVAVLRRAFIGLGAALADSIAMFDAGVLVIGGSMAASWDIAEPNIRLGMSGICPRLAYLPIVPAERPTDAPLVGAARWMQETSI